jgi:hypothetical protein
MHAMSRTLDILSTSLSHEVGEEVSYSPQIRKCLESFRPWRW